ncbi:MAG: adenine deaminase [Bacteroidota bacterium]
MQSLKLQGWFADFNARDFFLGIMEIDSGKIISITQTKEQRSNWPEIDILHPLILPGLIDAHVHIESSMVMPTRFAEMASRYGTVATVSDPHEIANVLGVEGIRLMIKDAKKAVFPICFTAPSCVPATPFESAGAVLEAAQLEPLFFNKEVYALGEVMNYPGVIQGVKEVIDKIRLAEKYGTPVDGHAPGVRGRELERYISAGIHTDHECFALDEAEEKVEKGMKILIREGSDAKNFEVLWPLISKYPDRVMLCTDDFQPDELAKGHIDRFIRRGLAKGLSFFDLYQAGSLNPVAHYGIPVGTLKEGDKADFILVDDLNEFHVLSTWIRGISIYGPDAEPIKLPDIQILNRFEAQPVNPDDLRILGKGGLFNVISAYDGGLITEAKKIQLTENKGVINYSLNRDILKIVVINRYEPAVPSVAWIQGFGIRQGAMASSIAHDSHNVIAVGTNDETLARAINLVIRNRGGIAVCSDTFEDCLPLPVAGLMSIMSVEETGRRYRELTERVRSLGSMLQAPFMTLSFMALLVIPHLKIGDGGLFDSDRFRFIPLRAE